MQLLGHIFVKEAGCPPLPLSPLPAGWGVVAPASRTEATCQGGQGSPTALDYGARGKESLLFY